MESKKCTKCKAEKPLTDFYSSKIAKDGKYSQCKTCHNFLTGKNIKMRLKSWKNGEHHVYLLPEEHYCGITDNPKWRFINHKATGKYIADAEVVMSFNQREQALQLEACFHKLGWLGENAYYRRSS